MDVTDTFVFIFSIVDGMTLLFLTVYFVSLNVYELNIYSSPISQSCCKTWYDETPHRIHFSNLSCHNATEECCLLGGAMVRVC